MSREAYRWRKKLICLGLACLMFLSGSLAACGRQTEQSAYHIEYLNKDKNRLVEEPYEPSATDTDGMIKEFLAKLSSDSDNVDYRKPIPNDVEITNYSLDGVLLTLHFDEDYSKMSAVDEVLVSLAKTGAACYAVFSRRFGRPLCPPEPRRQPGPDAHRFRERRKRYAFRAKGRSFLWRS